MEYQTILFKKNPVLFNSEAEALDALRSMKFTMGEPVIAMYGPSWKDAKLILAIGKRTAAGESAFDVIATSNTTDAITVDITNIKNTLQTHEETLASGNTPGHVVGGDYIDFSNGQGLVKKLSHTLSFSGGSTGKFDGSQDVSLKIPEPSNSLPLVSSEQAIIGTSDRWARADHVHPVQTAIQGNAGSATKLQTPKKIVISGAVTGNTTTDFSGDVNINTSVNHTHPSTDITDMSDIWDAINSKAPLNSPGLTGIPTAPTADKGTNTSQVATTEFVINEIQDKIEAAIALRFKGTLGTGGTITSLPAQHTTGDTYICLEGSPIIGGVPTEAGDIVICIRDSSTASDTDWAALQGNIVGTVQTGQGLQGGGNLKDGITISHQPKPTSGTAQGGNAAIVTDVSVDSLGHISEVVKSDITGKASAGNGTYLSDVWIEGTEIKGSTRTIPTIIVQNGEVEQNQYITGISVGTENNSHSLVVTKGSVVIPKLDLRNGENVSGQYVSGVSVNDHTIIVQRLNFPEESGKVKVSGGGIADYLKEKLITGIPTAEDIYGVEISENADKLSLSVKISGIDGNNNQRIKLKRSNISGETGDTDTLEEGEVFANTNDLYLYINNGTEVKRFYQNATSTKDGLMSKEDKLKLDLVSESVGDVGDISGVIGDLQNEILSEITDINSNITSIRNDLTTEVSNRTNGDSSLNQKITILDGQVVKNIQIGDNGSIMTPVSGTVVIPEANTSTIGLMTPSHVTEIYTNIPNDINSLKDTIDAYTINGYEISSNPTLRGKDITLSGYTEDTTSKGYVEQDDTTNEAVAKLQYQIKTEVSTRASEDTRLQGLINTEVSNRESADDELRELINTETTDRKNADNEFRELISTETTERKKEDTRLQGLIDAETTNREEAINDLKEEIENNVNTKLEELENEINTNINVKIEEIQGQLSGDGLSDKLGDTHYLQSSGNLVDALKALDSKLYEIEQAMLSSTLVKAAD